MKYSKIFFVIIACIIGNSALAAFNPRILVELMEVTGKLKMHAKLCVFAPEANTFQQTTNKFSNYLIPSKQEVLEKVAADHVQYPKIAAFSVCAVYEAYEKCAPKAFDRVDGAAFKTALTESAQLAFYNFLKQELIQKIRTKIDPYLKEGLRKTDIMQNIQNRKLVAALGYIAHRSLNCALDIGCDVAYSGIKGLVIK